jgi:hypothetical protein
MFIINFEMLRKGHEIAVKEDQEYRKMWHELLAMEKKKSFGSE